MSKDAVRHIWVPLVALAIAITVMFVVGALTSLIDHAFWSSFLSTVIGTLAGIIAGIPVALAINRSQETRVQQAAAAASADQAARNGTRVREVLLLELGHNDAMIESWRANLTKENPDPVKTGFSAERWEVLKASGEVAHISDIELLGAFADCYQAYAYFAPLAFRLLEGATFVGMAGGGTSGQVDVCRRLGKRMLEMIEKDIEPAHARLKARLPPPGTT